MAQALPAVDASAAPQLSETQLLHERRASHHAAGSSAYNGGNIAVPSWRDKPGPPAGAAWRGMPHPSQLTKRIMACSSVTELQQLWRQQEQHMNPIQITATLSRLASMCTGAPAEAALSVVPALLERVLGAAQQALPQCSPRQLSNIMCACARLQHPPSASWSSVWAACMLHQLPAASARDVSCSLWALASLGTDPVALHPSLNQELHSALVRTLCGGSSSGSGSTAATTRGNAQDVSSALWALASLGAPVAPEVMEALVLAAQRVQGSLKAQVGLCACRV